MDNMKLPEGTRLPSAKEWAYYNRTQPHSGVMQRTDEFGNTENVWFDKENPVTE